VSRASLGLAIAIPSFCSYLRSETSLAEIHRATDPGDVQTMRATAQLVGLDIGLDITVLHRQSPHEGTEEIAIHLRTLPTFAALHHSLGSLHPWAFWLEASRLAWAPWLAAARMLLGAVHAPSSGSPSRRQGMIRRTGRASGAAHGVTGGPS